MTDLTLYDRLVLLPPNRVWRTYPGGATLDRLTGRPDPADSPWSEDWIGSVTRAVNPGREAIAEGVSPVIIGEETIDFAQLLAGDPVYFLGSDHVAKYGESPMLLVKFLDSAVRLHFQCHPSRDFARRMLNSPSGKTEAYHILGVRDNPTDPVIYLGFQRPPTRARLRTMIEEQDMAALAACFDPVPVSPGDTFLIPGGTPHALGAGVFMVEIQEPTDFAVRLEFERAGFTLPEAARFMGRDIDFGLSMIDLAPCSRETINATFRCPPRDREPLSDASWSEILIGPDQTPCFRVHRLQLHDRCTHQHDTCSVNIVTAGELNVAVGGHRYSLKTYDRFFWPACLGPCAFNPVSESAQILTCLPPR